ncbi:MAG: hypothetical protein ABR540_22085 [Acidimicrobiales bacterium]
MVLASDSCQSTQNGSHAGILRGVLLALNALDALAAPPTPSLPRAE